jgi:hypothetical protein
MMVIRSIQLDVFRRVITKCKIEHDTDDWYTLGLYYSKEQQWKKLTRNEKGPRFFKNKTSAVWFAAELGFSEVILVDD